MSLTERLPVMASVSYVILCAALAQQEVIEADRASDGQASPPGKGLLLSSDPTAAAIGVEHGIRNAETLAQGRARPTRW